MPFMTPKTRARCPLLGLLLAGCLAASLPAQDVRKPEALPAPQAAADLAAVLGGEVRAIDLVSALQLAGSYNPNILLAGERVQEAVALRQMAAAQYLPSLNAGTNLNHHLGNLQRANGQLISPNRDSLYYGLGAGAVGSGTLSVPGLTWSGNLSDTYFRSLASRQV